MAKQPIRKTIDGFNFDIYPLPPKPALRVLTRLTKLIGEPLGLVGDAISGSKGSTKTDENGEKLGMIAALLEKQLPPDAFSRAAASLVNRLNEDEVINTIEVVVSNVHGQFEDDKGTRQINFEIDFTGRTGLMLKLFMACLEVNFSDFFGGKLGGVINLNRA